MHFALKPLSAKLRITGRGMEQPARDALASTAIRLTPNKNNKLLNMKDERMLQRTLFIFSMLMLISMSSSAAQVSNRVSIFVSYAGKDMIGQRIAGMLEGMIENSADYKIAPSHEAMMKVTISALSLNSHQPTEMGSAVSAIITMRNYLNYDPSNPQTWYPIFLGSNLVVISENKADEFASNTLSNIDAALERYRMDVRKYQQDIF